MSKKLDELRRLVNKLTNRYGAQDEAVIQLQSELDAVEAYEFRFSAPRYLSSHSYEFRTRAKRMYYASGMQPSPAALTQH